MSKHMELFITGTKAHPYLIKNIHRITFRKKLPPKKNNRGMNKIHTSVSIAIFYLFL